MEPLSGTTFLGMVIPVIREGVKSALQGGDMRIVSTEKAPAAVGHYSQGIVTGGLVFVSGQMPIDPATGEPVREELLSATVIGPELTWADVWPKA